MRCWPRQPCPGVRPGDTARSATPRGQTRGHGWKCHVPGSDPGTWLNWLREQELEQECVQLLGLVDSDQVARARDDDELRVLDALGEVSGDRLEVVLVVVADDHERRHRQR